MLKIRKPCIFLFLVFHFLALKGNFMYSAELASPFNPCIFRCTPCQAAPEQIHIIHLDRKMTISIYIHDPRAE
jgi:hypothetical protein